MICPLMKCECLGNKCSWWTKECEVCAVPSAAEYLDTLSFVFEKMEDMVSNDDD